MKRSIFKRLVIIIVVSMVVSLMLNYYQQVVAAYQKVLNHSQEQFRQIEQVLRVNEEETEQTEQEFAKECLTCAKAAAYIVQNQQELLESPAEMKRVAELLQVDELHIFDKEGTLYTGSESKYFGYNFNSGEQMQFFLPMLEDKSLELCQEITPNTAEQKMMQYAAVWSEDGERIVQIGMEPERVLKAMEKNELSYIFSLLTVDSNEEFYAIDLDTHEIMGAMDQDVLGKKAEDIGLDIGVMENSDKLYMMEVNGKAQCVSFRNTDSLILIRSYDRVEMFESVDRNSGLLVVYLFVLSLVIIFFILRYLDQYIIKSIANINCDLIQITEGNLEVQLPEQATPELSELSSHVNEMVKSILSTTNKLSLILQHVKVPIAVYEYNPVMKRVMVTSRMSEVLNLPEEVFEDYTCFKKRVNEIRENPVDQKNSIFRLPGEEERYVRLESFDYEKSILGIVLDVTSDILEKKSIEEERDIDLLTGLFNRRAFYARMEQLLDSGAEIGNAMILMTDADNLKYANDRYGHEIGDKYLREIARILRKSGAPGQVVARLSGDEFALFLYGCGTKEDLLKYVDEIRKERDAGCVLVGEERVQISFSIGCAFFPEEGEKLRDLLGLADERMYQNKRMRRGKR